MTNIRVVGAAAVALLLSATQGQTCTIVTNGTLDVYKHELAHCNGWTHPPFEPGANPPDRLVHPYVGVVLVYVTGDDIDGQIETAAYAQPDAEFIIEWELNAAKLCQKLWKENGIYAASKDIDRIVGCSIR